jgi:hypothetical protein
LDGRSLPTAADPTWPLPFDHGELFSSVYRILYLVDIDLFPSGREIHEFFLSGSENASKRPPLDHTALLVTFHRKLLKQGRTVQLEVNIRPFTVYYFT